MGNYTVRIQYNLKKQENSNMTEKIHEYDHKKRLEQIKNLRECFDDNLEMIKIITEMIKKEFKGGRTTSPKNDVLELIERLECTIIVMEREKLNA